MSLQRRLEVLRFIAQDLELGLYLARHSRSEFIGRTLARHVLVRAENFIVHADQLRKPLNVAGKDTRDFVESKRIYREEFTQYFQVGRDKLAGHVQDLDFLTRIELWHDVEVSKASFFVEGAHEIYNGVGRLGIAGFQPLDSFPELSDPKLRHELDGFAAENQWDGQVRIASDPLAPTRPGTAMLMNFTPEHQRASQLALIQRWLNDQMRLYKRVASFPNAERLLRTRIVTDVVSFADCLITRKDKKPEIEGLNDLLRINKYATARKAACFLDQFIQRFNYQSLLKPLRDARNSLGAHVSVDDSTSLADVIADFDAVSLKEMLEFFDDLGFAFDRACRDSEFLDAHLRDDTPYHSLRGPEHHEASPFDPTLPEIHAKHQFESRYNDVVVLHLQLDRWIASGNDHGEERSYWSNAFTKSPMSEHLMPHGEHAFEFRLAHEVMLERLRAVQSSHEAGRLLQLIEWCAGGSPRPLAEVLLRYAAVPGPLVISNAALLKCLARVAKWHQTDAQSFVKNCVNATLPDVRMQALVTAFDMIWWDKLGKREGLQFTETLEPLLAERAACEVIVALAAFAAMLRWGPYADSDGYFQKDFDRIRELLTTNLSKLGIEPDMYSREVAGNDFVALCLVAHAALKARDDNTSAFVILQAPGRWIPHALTPEGHLNLALAMARRGEAKKAIRIALRETTRFPENIEIALARGLSRSMLNFEVAVRPGRSHDRLALKRQENRHEEECQKYRKNARGRNEGWSGADAALFADARRAVERTRHATRLRVSDRAARHHRAARARAHETRRARRSAQPRWQVRSSGNGEKLTRAWWQKGQVRAASRSHESQKRLE